ncbi:MAG: 3-deoxy-D-manno-octulosonic acid kinase [Gammaproteobacteria bacterium]|nr:3-deoxy-D-manno-octulosonic acid kinase [Gammaproteobacteria bacterium]MDH3434694.1 3-deoxy-D-manno-octulosonic acid kinase [Gammaproteobacteria bacterium]
MTESVVETTTGAILFDRQIINEISEARFQAAGWLHAEPVGGALRASGRGNTMYVGNVPRQFVLRHYVRGGLIGKIVHDAYVWAGEDRTRPFAEWRLLAKMADSGLRVPRPAAARYRRHGVVYTADIITVRIPDVEPLSGYIRRGPCTEEFWQSLGEAVRAFHARGVFHADMNAYNLQIDKDGDLWMLDFDRGKLLPPGLWQQKTLSRLHRSLHKIATLDPQHHFRQQNWEQFLEGYFKASRSA